MLTTFLSAPDADRALRTFRKLTKHGIRHWVLAGGFAVELHSLSMGCKPSLRPLNDIDFIVESFDHIPTTLGDDFLFRHIHPFDPPGKTLLQCIDADAAVRIDVFRAYGATIPRSHLIQFESEKIPVVSLEDLVARMARLSLDIAEGLPIPSKYVTDFMRLDALVQAEQIDSVWEEHRKQEHPKSFTAAGNLIKNLVVSRPELLVSHSYSRNVEETCSRCASTSHFHLAPPPSVISLLGYC
jgi:hypothetical protein